MGIDTLPKNPTSIPVCKSKSVKAELLWILGGVIAVALVLSWIQGNSSAPQLPSFLGGGR